MIQKVEDCLEAGSSFSTHGCSEKMARLPLKPSPYCLSTPLHYAPSSLSISFIMLVQNMIQVLVGTPCARCAGVKLNGHPVRIFFPTTRHSSNQLSYLLHVSNFVQFWSRQDKNQLGEVGESEAASQLEIPANELEQVGDGSVGPQIGAYMLDCINCDVVHMIWVW